MQIRSARILSERLPGFEQRQAERTARKVAALEFRQTRAQRKATGRAAKILRAEFITRQLEKQVALG